jgi:hypothetical protein
MESEWTAMYGTDRQTAWACAKSAVRAYSRDPSRGNAERVEDAWAAVRRLDARSHWHAFQTRILDGRGTASLARAPRN